MLNGDPLLPAQDWDVYTDPFSEGQISKTVPAFFGILAVDGTEPKWENRYYYLTLISNPVNIIVLVIIITK
jgi:hypothetical protein